MKRVTLDSAVLSNMFLQHGDHLVAFFARRTLDAEIAVDLVSETFAQAVASRGRFRGKTEDEAIGWLYAIARHQYSNYVRRGIAERRALERLGVEPPALDDDDLARIDAEAELATLRAAVAIGMNGLSSQHQEVLRLRVVEERPYDEVARTLAISEQTARARVSRGLRGLAAAIKQPPQAKLEGKT